MNKETYIIEYKMRPGGTGAVSIEKVYYFLKIPVCIMFHYSHSSINCKLTEKQAKKYLKVIQSQNKRKLKLAFLVDKNIRQRFLDNLDYQNDKFIIRKINFRTL